MDKPKIELKNIDRRQSELEVVKKKAEYLTNQRIVQQQQAKALKELEQATVSEAEPEETPVVAPKKTK